MNAKRYMVWKQFDGKRWQFERWAIKEFRKALLITVRPVTSADSVEQAIGRVDYLDSNAITKAFKDVYGKVGSYFAVQSQSELKRLGGVFEIKSDMTVFDRLIRDWIVVYGADRIKDITETTIKRLKIELQRAFDNGDGIEVVARNIVKSGSGIADLKRARVIARTEIISASNKGSLEGARDLGIPLKKVWLATRDNRTRIDHAIADGQEVLMDQLFSVGGDLLDYPGDVKGSISNIIQCRCTQVYQPLVSGDSLQQPINSNLEVQQRPNEEGLREYDPKNAKLSQKEIDDFILNQKFNYDTSQVALEETEWINTKLKTVQNTISEMQGFNGLPSIVSDDDFIKLAKNTDEYVHMYRGVGFNSFIKEYYDGKVFASSYNMYGNGTYFASSNQYNIAKIYAANSDDRVFSAVFRKSDMKIGEFVKLTDEWESDKKKYVDNVIKSYQKSTGIKALFGGDFQKNNPDTYKELISKIKSLDDFGTWATSKGYDAYFVNVASPQQGMIGTMTEYYVVLNRTKLILPKNIRGKI